MREENYIFDWRGSLKIFTLIIVETSNRGGNVTPLHRLRSRIAVHASTLDAWPSIISFLA